jgi:hypothetical protein
VNAIPALAVRRIAVALEAWAGDRRSVAVAARLARVLNAEIEAVFIEDEDLIRLAGLPFLREVRLMSLAEESLDSRRIERELRSLARITQRALDDMLRAFDVRWTFRTWRGRTRSQLLDMAGDADIIAVHHCRSEAASGNRGAAAGRAGPAHRRTAVAVPFYAGEQSAKALAVACQIAGDAETELVVIAEPGAADPVGRQARDIVAACGRRARIVDAGADAAATLAAVADLSAVVSAAESPLFDAAGPAALSERLSCPVLVVR